MTDRAQPRGLLFDMDGLLFDTERLHLECYSAAVVEIGFEVEIDVYRSCIGTTVARSDEILMTAYGPQFPLADLKRGWGDRYHRALDEGRLELKTGAIELLERARARGIACALATSTGKATTLKKLALADLEDTFSHMVTGDDVLRGKPDPEPYVRAAAGLGVAPAQCWALEDSENGVRSAFAAGCHVIQVPDLVPPSPELRALGHRIVESLLVVADDLS